MKGNNKRTTNNNSNDNNRMVLPMVKSHNELILTRIKKIKIKIRMS